MGCISIVNKDLSNTENDWMKGKSVSTAWPPDMMLVKTSLNIQIVIPIVKQEQFQVMNFIVSEAVSQAHVMINVFPLTFFDIVTKGSNFRNQLRKLINIFRSILKVPKIARDLTWPYCDRSLSIFRTNLSQNFALCEMKPLKSIQIKFLFQEKGILDMLRNETETYDGISLEITQGYVMLGMFANTSRESDLLPMKTSITYHGDIRPSLTVPKIYSFLPIAEGRTLDVLYTDIGSQFGHKLFQQYERVAFESSKLCLILHMLHDESSHSTRQDQKCWPLTQRKHHFDLHRSVIKMILSNYSLETSLELGLYLADFEYHLPGLFPATVKREDFETVLVMDHFSMELSLAFVLCYVEKGKRECVICIIQSEEIYDGNGVAVGHLMLSNNTDGQTFATGEANIISHNTEDACAYMKCQSFEACEIDFAFDEQPHFQSLSVFDEKELLKFPLYAECQMPETSILSDSKEAKASKKEKGKGENMIYPIQCGEIRDHNDVTVGHWMLRDNTDGQTFATKETNNVSKNIENAGTYIKCQSFQTCLSDFAFVEELHFESPPVFDKNEMLKFLHSAGCQTPETSILSNRLKAKTLKKEKKKREHMRYPIQCREICDRKDVSACHLILSDDTDSQTLPTEKADNVSQNTEDAGACMTYQSLETCEMDFAFDEQSHFESLSVFDRNELLKFPYSVGCQMPETPETSILSKTMKAKTLKKEKEKREDMRYPKQCREICDRSDMTAGHLMLSDNTDGQTFVTEETNNVSQNTENAGTYIKCQSFQTCLSDFAFVEELHFESPPVFDKNEMLKFLHSAGCQTPETSILSNKLKAKTLKKEKKKREHMRYPIQCREICDRKDVSACHLILSDDTDSQTLPTEEADNVSQNTENPGTYMKYHLLETCKIDFAFDEWSHFESPSVFDRNELLKFLHSAGYQMPEMPETCILSDRMKAKTSNKFDDILHHVRWTPVIQESVVAPFVSLRNYFGEVAQGKTHSLREKMACEGLRLKSFHKVKIDASCIHLAAAGFYATGDGDETRCYSCGVSYKKWQRGDNPFQVHQRISPNCPYTTGSDTSNVPIDSTVSHSVHSADLMNVDAVESNVRVLQDNTEILGATSNYDPRVSTVPISICGSTKSNCNTVSSSHSCETDVSATSRARSTINTVNLLSFSNVVYPTYSKEKARITSFLTWPEGHCKKPADLVPVGFFYAGYSDCVRCFCCGVGLRTWEREDDPWMEHVRWRSSCEYVKAVKGDEFITQALAGLAKNNNGTGNTSLGQTRNDVLNILSRDVCKQALEMGFGADSVRQHASDIIQSQGTLQLDVLVERLLTDEGIQEPNGSIREQAPPRIQHGHQGATSELNSQHYTETVPSASNEQTTETPEPLPDRLSWAASDAGDQQAEQNQWTSKPGEPQARVIQVLEDIDDEGYGGSNGIEYEPTDALRSLDSSDVHARNNSGNGQDMFKSMPIMSKSSHTSGKDTGVTLTTISEENREMRESGLCKICLDGPANIVFLPCGHLVACATCSPALERCPVCRTFIRGSVRVHLTGMASISHDVLQE